MLEYKIIQAMADWELFELECSKYLDDYFIKSPFSFKSSGGANSTTSDISVFNNKNQNIFNIEAKLSPCQSGQFVIAVKKGEFVLSPRNKFNNSFSNIILDFLNKDFENYNKVEQKALNIDIEEEYMFGWIKEHYKYKNSLFVITSTILKGFKVILSIDDLKKYFEVSACLRRKKSGTQNVPKRDYDSAIVELKKKVPNGERILKISKEEKLFIEFQDKSKLISRANRSIGEKYFLSPEESKGSGFYSLRKKSKTNNINVIFSLNYKGSKQNLGLDLLKKKLV